MPPVRLTASLALSVGAIAAAACTETDTAMPPSQPDAPDFDILSTVAEADGAWTATYRVRAPGTRLVLPRSGAGYRQESWRPLSPGASVEASEAGDVLVFGAAAEARFAIEPETGFIPGEYTPFVPFSDGGVAVHTAQFLAIPEDAQTGPGTGEAPSCRQRLRLTSDKPIIGGGGASRGVAEFCLDAGEAYAFVGPAAWTEGRSYVGVVDPGLPAWIRDGFDAELSRVFERLEEGFGTTLPERTTVLFAYGGAQPQGLSNQGGAIGNSLMLQAAGSALSSESPAVREIMQWFFAHEATHLFQRAAEGKAPPKALPSWLLEGSANAAANEIVAGLGRGRAYRLSVLSDAIEACTAHLGGGSVVTARDRGQQQAVYECGDIAVLAALAMARDDASLGSLWRAVLEETTGDGEEEGPEAFLRAASRIGVRQDGLDALRRFLTEAPTSPRAAVLDVLRASAIDPAFSEDGRVTAASLPRIL